jgi:hypothetical protein
MGGRRTCLSGFEAKELFEGGGGGEGGGRGGLQGDVGWRGLGLGFFLCVPVSSLSLSLWRLSLLLSPPFSFSLSLVGAWAVCTGFCGASRTQPTPTRPPFPLLSLAFL